MRYPELRAKQGIPDEEEMDETEFEEILPRSHQERKIVMEESIAEDSLPFEFMDPENPEYDEERLEPENCIIETLEAEPPCDIEKEEILVVAKQETIVEVKEERLKSNECVIKLVPDSIALKSLKILIKYSEQRGNLKYLSHLLEYQNELEQLDLQFEES
jgi:hypothetical protein